MITTSEITLGASLAPNHADLLRRASSDEGFRRELERDPAAALAGFGIQIDPEQVPDKVALPTEDEFRMSLDSVDNDSYVSNLRWAGLFAH